VRIINGKQILGTPNMPKKVREKNCFYFVTLQRLILASVLIGMPKSGAAIEIQSITDAEMALIPRYCAYAQSFPKYNTPEGRQWEARLGEKSFSSIHHYCWGLVNLQRAMRSSTSRGRRLALLSTITGDFEYSIRGSAKDFVLLPEMLTRNGEVYLLRSLPSDANKSFSQARALKADYWPAYSRWVEFLMYSGKTTEAKILVKAGLKHSPNSKVLREQDRLLSGNSSKTAGPIEERPSAGTAEDATTPQSAQ
jgi:hypothetical protein